jgi:hypothetical protein
LQISASGKLWTHSDQNSNDGFAAMEQVFSFGKKRVGAAAKA